MANNNENTAGDDLVSAATEKLLGQSDIISSEDTQIETKIGKAISGIKSGQEASAAKLESEAAREIEDIKEAGGRKLTSTREAQRGFATNRALLSQISEETEKSVRDLDQRKEELILAGEAAAAGQISNLQIKQLQFEQQAKQQAFSNMLAIAGFGLQIQVGERAEKGLEIQERGMDFTENQAKSTLALQYGVSVEEGDTFTDIVKKAAPMANAQQLKQLELVDAQIKNMNASTAKLMKDTAPLSAMDIDNIATAALLNPAVLGQIKNPDDLAKVINLMGGKQIGQIKTQTLQNIKGGGNLTDTINSIMEDISIIDKQAAIKEAQKWHNKYNQAETPEKKANVLKAMQAVGQPFVDASSAILEFFTGTGLK